MTPEQSQKTKNDYDSWTTKMGQNMVDMGAPIGDGRSLTDDGTTGSLPAHLNGYTIIQADNFDTAMSLLEGHPFLSDRSGKFSIDVLELIPVPGGG